MMNRRHIIRAKVIIISSLFLSACTASLGGTDKPESTSNTPDRDRHGSTQTDSSNRDMYPDLPTETDKGSEEDNEESEDSSDTKKPEQNREPLVFPLKVMHGDVFGEYEGRDPLPKHGGDSPRYVEKITFEVDQGGGPLWVWGHSVGFKYFGDWFEWKKGKGNAVAGGPKIDSSYDAPYDGRAKGAVRINGGEWIDLTDENVTCARVEEKQKCIGGLASATRFKVDGTSLQAGKNTVEFAFLGHDMLSSGYRILEMAALPADYDGSLSHREVRPANEILNPIKKEDPHKWTKPKGSDPAKGKKLWHNSDLRDFPGGPKINATCNDCHAHNGRDMKYFNYSNESLVVRARHHGLSEKQGKHIAAYIRSYQLDTPDGETYKAPGRPWNPPYQPGPRLAAAGTKAEGKHPDKAPGVFWSSGAGLEWVADSERQVLPYVFPDGTANHDAGPFEEPPGIEITRREIDPDGPRMNLREIPLSIQLPDWNYWLPIIHPKDAYGMEYWKDSTGYGSIESDDGRQNYLDARKNIPKHREQGQSKRNLRKVRRAVGAAGRAGTDTFRRTGRDIIREGKAWNRTRTRVSRGGQPSNSGNSTTNSIWPAGFTNRTRTTANEPGEVQPELYLTSPPILSVATKVWMVLQEDSVPASRISGITLSLS